jgi:hypothetical protein
MDDELERTLAELAEQIQRVETTVKENRLELGKMAIALDAIAKRTDKTEERLLTGKDAIEKLQERSDSLFRSDAEVVSLTEKLSRAIAEMENRFAGKTLTGMAEQPSYEAIVSILLALRTRLSGGEGQLSYEAVRRSIEDSRFLGAVVKGLIGLFGVGALLAAGNSLIGGEDLSPAVVRVQEQIKELTNDFSSFRAKMESEDRERVRRLEDKAIAR